MKVKLKSFDGIERLYTQARAIVPEDSDALFDFGHLCRIVNKMPEAEAALRRSLKLDEQRAYGHYSRGHKYAYLADILQHLGRIEEAIAAGREAVACHPDDAEKAAKLGSLYAAAGRKGEAGDWYHRALAINPSMPGLQQRLKELTRIG